MISWFNSIYNAKLLCHFIVLFCFIVSTQMAGFLHLAWAESSFEEFISNTPPRDPDNTELVVDDNYDIIDKCMNDAIGMVKNSEKSKTGKLLIIGDPLVTKSRKFGIVFRLDFNLLSRGESDYVYRFICWAAHPYESSSIATSVDFNPGKPLRGFRN